MTSKKQDYKMNKRNNFKNNNKGGHNNHHHPKVSHHRKLMANFWSERLQRMICDGAMATLLASTRESLQQQQPQSEEGKAVASENGESGAKGSDSAESKPAMVPSGATVDHV